MIITADIGCTAIKIGFFNDGTLVKCFKMGTDIKRTGDEYVTTLLQLMALSEIDGSEINGIAVSCVVPQLDYTLKNALAKAFGVKPVSVGFGTRTGLICKNDSFGSDRIVACSAALKQYGAPFILVDFGTTTTFTVVNERGEMVGGAITLGIKSTLEGIGAISNMPCAEIKIMQNVVAQSAVQSVQSGVIFGTVGQVKYIVELIKAQMNLTDAKTIATGGYADIVNEIEPVFNVVDENLSLKGLYEIYKLNL